MHTKIVEVVSGMCWCKFLVARFEPEELAHPSQVDMGRTVMGPHHDARSLLVLDIGTGEGAVFTPGGSPSADLYKHAIWVSPLFGGFLKWLYALPKVVLADLPDLVELGESFGGERGSPLDELLKRCLRSDDKEMRAMARSVWQGEHGDTSLPPGTPPTLADVRRWVGPPPE
jgi:hypothetical protein